MFSFKLSNLKKCRHLLEDSIANIFSLVLKVTFIILDCRKPVVNSYFTCKSIEERTIIDLPSNDTTYIKLPYPENP